MQGTPHQQQQLSSFDAPGAFVSSEDKAKSLASSSSLSTSQQKQKTAKVEITDIM